MTRTPSLLPFEIASCEGIIASAIELPRYISAEELKTVEDIVIVLQAAASQLNACSVALADLGYRGYSSDKPLGKLLAAFCDATAAANEIRATLVEAA
jgi:hypothetical protein